MKQLAILITVVFSLLANAQTAKVELYDLVKSLLYDSTGFENVGDWAVGRPKKFPVAWKADRIEISNDTSINFFRQGTANVLVNGTTISSGAQLAKWSILLKGPRMGYSSFSIVSSGSADLRPTATLDSIFANKPMKAKLLKTCENGPAAFYYYEVKMPKKDLAYLKLSWLTIGDRTALRIDGYDPYSQYAAKLNCPR